MLKLKFMHIHSNFIIQKLSYLFIYQIQNNNLCIYRYNFLFDFNSLLNYFEI